MKKIILFAISCGIAFGVLFYLWVTINTSPVDQKNTFLQTFSVEKGESISNIALLLKEQHLIKNDSAFVWIVKIDRLGNKIQAGDFQLSQSMSASQIAHVLTHGSHDIYITVPDGKRAEEVASILQKQITTYDPSWLTVLKQHEGYLFPETYAFAKNASINDIIQTMTDTFNKRYANIQTNTSLSQEQVVILASLVEREGSNADRPLIASVFMNRLKAGMPLQVDATVQYALGYNNYEQSWWKKDLTTFDLTYQSPFNTYINTGLPPGPICSPGQKALEAAANPAQTDYFYYLADKQGNTHFAKTLAEHNANIKKYGL